MQRGLRFGLMITALVFMVSGAVAQEESGMPPMGAPEEMKHVEQYNGVWDVVFKYKMDPMAAEWTETKALSTISMMLDGAVQKQEFSGEMMGMKFVGEGLKAYNRETKTWQNSWTDNFSAAISLYTGEMKDGKLVFTGVDKMQGMDIHTRMTIGPVADGQFSWTMEMSMDGENYMKNGMATYTKR